MHRQVKGYYELANEYHIAAVTLCVNIIEAPYLYNPISYLLRHTTELLLKGLIIKELRKDNKKLIINNVKIGSCKLDNAHSLLYLWEYYKSFIDLHGILINKEEIKLIDKTIKKIDLKDFSSTRYRYPFDKKGKSMDVMPVDIYTGTIAPDLELGIPSIIQFGDQVGIVEKGSSLLKLNQELLEVVELLFVLIES